MALHKAIWNYITKQIKLIKLIYIHGDSGSVKVIVEVIAILFASQERSTYIKTKQTGENNNSGTSENIGSG